MTIDDFVADLVRRCDVAPEPPIDLVRVAQRLGVDEITEAQLVEDGRLEHTPYHVRILLQQDASYPRKRFTLAHELGHVVLTDPDSFVVARRYRPRADQEERFCDAFAAALLLPRAWVEQRWATAQRSLRVVRAMSDTAHVSLAASAIRLNEILGWDRTLLRWRRSDDGRWRLVATTGLPYRLQGAVRSAPGTSAWLQALQPGSRDCHNAVLPLLVDGRPRVVNAEVARLETSAVALVNFAAG